MAWRSPALAFVLALGCGGETTGEEQLFVGSLAGGDVLAATLWSDTGTVFYSCGRDAMLEEGTAWIDAVPDLDGRIEGADGAVTVNVANAHQRVVGDVSFDGEIEAATLLPADSAHAGLFSLIDGPCRTAAIVMETDGEVLVQGAHFCGDGPFFQVTPIRPRELLAGTLGETLEVRFDDGTGAREVELSRVLR